MMKEAMLDYVYLQVVDKQHAPNYSSLTFTDFINWETFYIGRHWS